MLWLGLIVGGIYSQPAKPATPWATAEPLGQEPQPAAQGAAKEFAGVSNLMRDGLHEEFTCLAFIIWHDPPMTPQKMSQVAETANRLGHLAGRIPMLGKLRWSEEELQTIKARSADLAQAAEKLAGAAKMGDEPALDKLLVDLENSCMNCHAKFRKDLVNK